MKLTDEISRRCDNYQDKAGKPPERILLGKGKFEEMKALAYKERGFTIDKSGNMAYEGIPIVESTDRTIQIQVG